MSTCDSLYKEGGNLTKLELNHVQSTTWETSSYGDPELRPPSQSYEAKKPKKSSSTEGEETDNTGSSLAESVRTEPAPR